MSAAALRRAAAALAEASQALAAAADAAEHEAVAERPPSYMTTSEVAELLRTDAQRVRVLIAEARLPAVRDGRRLLVSRHAVDNYLEAE